MEALGNIAALLTTCRMRAPGAVSSLLYSEPLAFCSGSSMRNSMLGGALQVATGEAPGFQARDVRMVGFAASFASC